MLPFRINFVISDITSIGIEGQNNDIPADRPYSDTVERDVAHHFFLCEKNFGTWRLEWVRIDVVMGRRINTKRSIMNNASTKSQQDPEWAKTQWRKTTQNMTRFKMYVALLRNRFPLCSLVHSSTHCHFHSHSLMFNRRGQKMTLFNIIDLFKRMSTLRILHSVNKKIGLSHSTIVFRSQIGDRYFCWISKLMNRKFPPNWRILF